MENVQISIDRDKRTRKLQLSICLEKSHGYRIFGPKYEGKSENLICYTISKRDAKEIQSYLDMVE